VGVGAVEVADVAEGVQGSAGRVHTKKRMRALITTMKALLMGQRAVLMHPLMASSMARLFWRSRRG
jgi:hypothetical protein